VDKKLCLTPEILKEAILSLDTAAADQVENCAQGAMSGTLEVQVGSPTEACTVLIILMSQLISPADREFRSTVYQSSMAL